jgi:hypothetical protein
MKFKIIAVIVVVIVLVISFAVGTAMRNNATNSQSEEYQSQSSQ